MILVDTNVIIDVLADDPVWADWSEQQLRLARARGGVGINAVVYAELCVRPGVDAHVDDYLRVGEFSVTAIGLAAARAAAHAFRTYRQRGGTKTGVLPDFFIGAQALTEGWTLLTRDAARYQTYFPRLKLICP